MPRIGGMEKVDFWFDPSCPWTWVTSLWMCEVASLRDIEVNWHPFSLYFLNEGRELDPDYRKLTDYNFVGSRVTGAVAVTNPEKLSDFFMAVGTKYHNEARGKEDYEGILKEALGDCGLEAELFDRATAGEFDDFMRESTKAGLDIVGDQVGVPIVSFNDVGFFGPVIAKVPRGDEALKLWDGCLAAASVDSFYELKRSRNVKPQFD